METISPVGLPFVYNTGLKTKDGHNIQYCLAWNEFLEETGELLEGKYKYVKAIKERREREGRP